MAAQLWDGLSAELPDIGEQLERGDFAPLREWLYDRVHVHGRKFTPPELLRRATGQELAVTPFLDYLSAKLRDAGVLPPPRPEPRRRASAGVRTGPAGPCPAEAAVVLATRRSRWPRGPSCRRSRRGPRGRAR